MGLRKIRFALLLMAVACPRFAAAQTTALFVDSQPGDYIGQGQRQLITPSDTDFSSERTDPRGVRIRAARFSAGFWLDVKVCTPGPGFQPATGVYEAARRLISCNFTELEVSGSGRGCNVLTGRYVVREAVYAGDGTVQRFAADFEQHCEDADAALFGAIRYNSTVSDMTPFGGDYPRRRITVAAPTHGRVTGGGVDCGAGGATCAVDLPAVATVGLTAISDPGYIFGGWSGDCTGGAVATVNVNSRRSCAAAFLPAVPDAPRTLAVLNSGPGDYLTYGFDDIFTDVNSRWTLSPTGVVTPRQVAIAITGPGSAYPRDWMITVSGPFGEDSLQAGRQYTTADLAGPGVAKLSLATNSNTCSEATGIMNVREWVPGTTYIPVRFAIDFVYECLGGIITGTLEYNSTQSFPRADVDRASLAFGAAMNTTGMLAHTPDQTVRLTIAGATDVPWGLQWDQPWLTVTPTSTPDGGIVTVGVTSASGLPDTGRVTGHLDVLTAGTETIAQSITITLDLHRQGTTTAPVGSFDTPVEGATAQGSIAVTGWALDDLGMDRVEIWRDLQAGETTPPFQGGPTDPRAGKIFVGTGTFVEGARPDVAAAFSSTPLNTRAGWGYLLLTWGLWSQGNGAVTLHAFAFDQEGKVATLGTRHIVANNAAADRPFGSIDTPGIGATAAGTIVNFGWALTPKMNGAATCTVPPGGVQVSIDSGPLQPVVYGDARSDIAGAFTGFSNSSAAGGHYYLDTTQYANGTHTIGWLITDSCNRADGVGSRFFTVQNSGLAGAAGVAPSLRAPSTSLATVRDESEPITVAHGYGELPEVVWPDASGLRSVRLTQGDRVEIRLPRGYDRAVQSLNGAERPLPTGASWDPDSRTFYWQPAAAFLGDYDLAFRSGNAVIRVRVTVAAAKM